MLVQFSVGNFRSFRDTQTLSLAASVSSGRRDQHSMETNNSFAPQVLRSVCLLGANGSGKTGFLKAMKFFASFVVNSATQYNAGDEIEVEPFKLSDECIGRPSEFEAIFILDGTLYQYGFSADSERIVEEWLSLRRNTPRSQMRSVFHRYCEQGGNHTEWEINESLLTGERELWKKSTRENGLFLSTAVNLNSEVLEPVYEWIKFCFRSITSPERLSKTYSARRAREAEFGEKIIKFMESNDLAIDGIESDEIEFEIDEEVEKVLSRKFIDDVKTNKNRRTRYVVKTFHKNEHGQSVEFSLDDESSGTKVLFGLSGPILDVLDNGYTLFVDELHNSLHPLALKNIITMFHSSKSNAHGAQLIFTTHETSVLSNRTMHRDQIWFVEKGGDGASFLRPLSDYKVRDFEAFERSYLAGRYGALPHISSLDHAFEE